jgi:predicted ester cyclase
MPATGRRVSWAGAAFFTFSDDRIADLWVLGDVDALRRQLAGSDPG